ncbi:SH3 domain-containing protein [Microlunatus soli]|uniref:Uncharacterized conserved protein YgiM, contains N-terminal SH3 domain, DUF1202 family n=1 Tax=Microlunatus soli TaxID=630515 RepID=A0A1H1VXI4_9ACTN|nr:SH3 domain-containing protein [Microlunatus soli]SDS89151.1 Uncharacterized conserved protein YgiM, contains N-terminal SH3 domain, DUF1202 family [Microlunatus soli]
MHQIPHLRLGKAVQGGKTVTTAIRKVGAAAIAATAGAAITIGGAQLATANSATATTGVNIRSGPGTSYDIVGGLVRGQRITTVGKADDGWMKVRFNGDTGYVSAQYLGTDGKSVGSNEVTISTKGVKIATAALNVRATPTLGAKVVGYISDGQKVSLTGKQSKGFAEVLYGGSRAWVSSQYLISSWRDLPSSSGTKVATADLLIRTSTDSAFMIITTAPKGTKLKVTGTTRNGYAQIVYGDAIRWVTAKYLSNSAVSGPSSSAPEQSSADSSKKSTSSNKKSSSNKTSSGNKTSSSKSSTATRPSTPSVVGTRYATTELLVRSTAGSDYRTVATVDRGDTVKITGRTSNGRAQIVYDGSVRWVTAQYLSSSKPRAASKPDSKPSTSPAKNTEDKSSAGLDPTYKGDSRNVADSTWDELAMCESSGNWSINTGNGFYGGLQFTAQTWRGFGGTGMPQDASRSEQIKVAERVLAVQGWGAWPACSSKLGLR